MKARPIERIHFIEYNAKVGTLGNGAILPKYGTALLAAILRERGYQVRMFLEGVSDMSFEKITDCDLVCFPVYYPILNKVAETSARIRESKPGLTMIMGGPQACMFTESVVDKCDYAVRCEGDEVLPELVECLSRGGDPSRVKGISYRDGDRIVHTPDREAPEIPHTAPDLTLIEGIEQATSRFGLNVANTLQTSRGCKFNCKFCPTSKLFAGKYRNRDIYSIIQEIRSKMHFSPFFFVVDNSFLSNRKRTIALLHRLIQEDLGAHFMVFERHEIGRDGELLDLMWQAGVRCIIVGIESFDDQNLKQYNKKQTGRRVIDSVRNIQRHNMHVLGTFVLGGDEDTAERADQIIQFVEQTGISLNLFIMHDIEEDETKGLMTPLNRRFYHYYRRSNPENTDWCDYLTGNFVTYFPKRMKPSTLQASMAKVFDEVFSHRNNIRRTLSGNLFNATFGVGHGYGMRRLAETIRVPVDGFYMDYLRRIEDGLYDQHEVLIEEKLAGIERLPLLPPLQETIDTSSYRNLSNLLVVPGAVRIALGYARARATRFVQSRLAVSA